MKYIFFTINYVADPVGIPEEKGYTYWNRGNVQHEKGLIVGSTLLSFGKCSFHSHWAAFVLLIFFIFLGDKVVDLLTRVSFHDIFSESAVL